MGNIPVEYVADLDYEERNDASNYTKALDAAVDNMIDEISSIDVDSASCSLYAQIELKGDALKAVQKALQDNQDIRSQLEDHILNEEPELLNAYIYPPKMNSNGDYED